MERFKYDSVFFLDSFRL